MICKVFTNVKSVHKIVPSNIIKGVKVFMTDFFYLWYLWSCFCNNIRPSCRTSCLQKAHRYKLKYIAITLFFLSQTTLSDKYFFFFHSECEFVEKHRDELIRRVSSVMTIADGLRTKDMIPDEMYSKVHAAEPRQEKTRLLLDALDSGGTAVKAEFYKLLKNEEPHLVDELESGPSRPQQL